MTPADPEEDYPNDDPIDFTIRQRQQPINDALTSLDDPPEDAARALELSESTGAHPALVYGDLENFEHQHKAQLTAELLQRNEFLRQYAASNPMAAKVSNNDWGQLDAVSQAIQKFHQTRVGQALDAPSTTMAAAARGFVEGFHGSDFFTYVPNANPIVQSEMLALGYPAQLLSRVFQGVTEAGRAGAEQLQLSLGADPLKAAQRAQEFAGLLEAELGGLSGRAHVGEPAQEAAAQAFGNRFREAARLAKPYIDARETPPHGLHSLIDEAHEQQLKQDMDIVDEVYKESQKSSTRELAPDLFKDFIDLHAPNQKIGISPEGLKALYGDGVPELDDNKLGWVPGIKEQYDLALASGRDVEIPLSDWLAKATPETVDAVHDFIRTREVGPTLEELEQAKEAEEGKPTQIDEALPAPPSPIPDVEAVRKGAGLSDSLLPGGKDRSIVPATAESYKGGEIAARSGETFTPYMNFPLKDALAKVRLNESGIPTVLQEFFKDRLAKLAGDVPVRIVKDADMKRISAGQFGESRSGDNYALAFYAPNTDEIYMSDRLASGQARTPGFANYALLHEGAHALSVRAMEENPELGEKVKSMMRYAQTYLIRMHDDAIGEPGHAYAFQNEKEFWAQAWSDTKFQHTLSMMPMSEELAGELGMKPALGNSIYDAFRRIVQMLLQKVFPGHDIPQTMVDGLFHMQREFEQHEAQARGVRLGKNEALAAAPEGEVPRPSTGMSKKEFELRMKHIQAQREADLKLQQDRADRVARQQQTKEWKENFADTKKEVEADLKQRPDIAADRFLRLGELNGKKAGKVRLATSEVPPELRSKLPPDYFADNGFKPDDVAGLFGYQSGEQLVRRLVGLESEREVAGLTPAAHFSAMVNAETERVMRQRFGDLETNILEEAKDHITSETQLDLVHDKLLELSHNAGQLPQTKADMKAAIRDKFNQLPNSQHSRDGYLAQAGRAGRIAEFAQLEGDAKGAFKAKQDQYMSLLLADEAKKLEKKRGQFDRKVESSWSKREPPGVPQKDAVWIHDILLRIGEPVKRSVQDLQRQKDLVSEHKSLRDYVEAANKKYDLYDQDPDAMSIGQELNVDEGLMSANWPDSVDKMTPEEFEATFNSLKSIDHFGREDNKFNVKGEKRDLAEVVDGLVARLKAAVDNKPATMEAHKRSVGRTIGSLLLNPETWFNRLDVGNRQGPFNQLIVRPITEGQYTLRTLEREFAQKWKALGDFPDVKKKIENTLFRDQDGDMIPMTKGNAYAVLANMGNALQRKKLLMGWGLAKTVEDMPRAEGLVWHWLTNVAGITKEDLARAQAMGKVFSDAFEHSEIAYTHTAGVAPARIDLGRFQTPFGETDEWYHPLIPDPLRTAGKLTADDLMGEGQGFWKPSPSAGYTKTRTGKIYNLDLSFESVPFKLKQILNDAAMRIPVTEVSKIIFHKQFQDAFKKFYGPEYAAGLDHWMKDVAGNRQWVPSNLKALDVAVSALQRNLSTLLIGFNLSTVFKHAPTAGIFSAAEVGTGRFLDSLRHIIQEYPGSRERWNFAMENSEELQNRMRNIADTIVVQNRELFPTVSGFRKKVQSFRDTVEHYGHAPVGYTDLYSAVAMWDAEYRRLSEEHPDMDHGDIVYAANTAVRRTHGSSILSNRSGLLRYNSPFARMIVPFYNFMSNALQRNYELAWKARLAIEGRSLPEMAGFLEDKFEKGPQNIKPLIGGLMVYGVMVSLIENMVDPLPQEPKESGVKHWGKILTRGYPSMIPGVRDAVNYLYSGHDPSIGLYGIAARNVEQSLDPKSYERNPGQAFRTANRLFGTLSGLTTEPIGRAGEFAVNTLAGYEHPKGMGDLFKGIYKGTLREPRRR